MVKYKVRSRQELIKIIDKALITADLNYLDVSNVTDMSYLFFNSDFNGDISNWDVSNVTDMTCMFFQCKNILNISKWDLSNLKNYKDMFTYSAFLHKITKDINLTDITNVKLIAKFSNNDL